MANLRDLGMALRAFEESVGTIGPRRAAEAITAELQDAGPAWTGTFRNAWRILPGEATGVPSIARLGVYEPGDRPNPVPVQRQRVPPVSFGTRFSSVFTKNKTLYTITNLALYREVAMDLVPGRAPPRTAPQDWFITYLGGGALDRTLTVAMDSALRGIL
jgi:hypothetical protein